MRERSSAAPEDPTEPFVEPRMDLFLRVLMTSLAARIVLLLLLGSLVAVGEVVVRGRKANRWREYLFVAGGGLLGSLIGSAIDSVTSRIGPSYFVLGKGLEGGPGLELRAAALGAHAGACAGAALAGLLLIAAGPFARLESGGARRLARACLQVGGWSLVSAMLVGTFGWVSALPIPSTPPLPNCSPEENLSFTGVWWTHLGAYAGFLGSGVYVLIRALLWRRAEDLDQTARSGGRHGECNLRPESFE